MYDEMLDVSLPLLGWFSEMTSCPLGVNDVAKTPGVTLVLLATAPRVPSGLIGNRSMLLEAFSITTSHRPLGLTETEDAPESRSVRNVVEFATSRSLPKTVRFQGFDGSQPPH